jgi:MSHA pilin protein MshD
MLVSHRGVTLIELIAFIVVVSVGLVALLAIFDRTLVDSVNPIVQIKATEKAQALMEEILTRKFDENTPTGGVPACDSTSGSACAGIAADSGYDDVGDYNGYSVTDSDGFTVAVSVTLAGTQLGLADAQARLIVITVTTPKSKVIKISAYRVNF